MHEQPTESQLTYVRVYIKQTHNIEYCVTNTLFPPQIVSISFCFPFFGLLQSLQQATHTPGLTSSTVPQVHNTHLFLTEKHTSQLMAIGQWPAPITTHGIGKQQPFLYIIITIQTQTYMYTYVEGHARVTQFTIALTHHSCLFFTR